MRHRGWEGGGWRVTAFRMGGSRTGRGLRWEVSGTEESETLGFKCADWRCVEGGRGLGEKQGGQVAEEGLVL